MVYGVPIWKQENFYQGALRSKFAAPFSEHYCPFGPLVGDLIKHLLKVTGSVHRFCTYKIFVSTLCHYSKTNNEKHLFELKELQ